MEERSKKIKVGDLVKIDSNFFGYESIFPQWYDSIFMVVEEREDKKRSLTEPHTIYRVLSPDGCLYDFYDHELLLI